MFRLVWRQLQHEPLRTLLTAVAVGSVIAVILVLEGFEQGQYYQLETIIKNRRADLIASQSGVGNFIATRSSIPQLVRADIEKVPGVVNAHPITALPIIYSQDGILTPVYVLVFDSTGGPASIIAGHSPTNSNEIIIDQSLAIKYKLKIGDPFIVSDFEFRVAGMTSEAAFMMPLAFISYDSMIDLFIESEIAPDLSTFPLVSFLLIELKPGFDLDSVAKQIEVQVPAVDVFTPTQLAQRDVDLGKVFFKPIMGLLVSIGYIIGLLVVGLIMYADASSKSRNFAIAKALGFPFKALFRAVLIQSLLLLLLAIPFGILVAQGITEIIHHLSPVYLIRIFTADVFTQTLIASIGFAVFGSLIPLRSIQRTDPLLAFQGT